MHLKAIPMMELSSPLLPIQTTKTKMKNEKGVVGITCWMAVEEVLVVSKQAMESTTKMDPPQYMNLYVYGSVEQYRFLHMAHTI
jgi:hypothetical protein